jgi:hypothetical protein
MASRHGRHGRVDDWGNPAWRIHRERNLTHGREQKAQAPVRAVPRPVHAGRVRRQADQNIRLGLPSMTTGVLGFFQVTRQPSRPRRFTGCPAGLRSTRLSWASGKPPEGVREVVIFGDNDPRRRSVHTGLISAGMRAPNRPAPSRSSAWTPPTRQMPTARSYRSWRVGWPSTTWAQSGPRRRAALNSRWQRATDREPDRYGKIHVPVGASTQWELSP